MEGLRKIGVCLKFLISSTENDLPSWWRIEFGYFLGSQLRTSSEKGGLRMIKGTISWDFFSVPFFSHFWTPSSSFGLSIHPSEFTHSRFLNVIYLPVFFPFSYIDDSGIKNSVFVKL